MEFLILLLLLLGPCSSPSGEALFCEGPTCDAMALDGGGGDGGAASASGEGGAGGSGPGGDGGSAPAGCASDIECDDSNPCNGTEWCTERGECETVNNPTPVDDDDRCTRNLCRDGLPHYEPVDVDDGNPCTRDSCHPVFGVEHNPIEGCQS
jgi:hypothetical protein